MAELSHKITIVGIRLTIPIVKRKCFFTITVILMDIYTDLKAPHKGKAVIKVNY